MLTENRGLSPIVRLLFGTNQRKVFQSRIVADGKMYLMRLVVEDWHQPPVIVTVYRTSKIEKYWGKP